MTNTALDALLAGSEDEMDLLLLYQSIAAPKNESQRTFHRAYEALVLLMRDGFEKLFEQDTALEDYARSLGDVGLRELQPIFDEVAALVPAEVRESADEDVLFDHLEGLFDELKRLAHAGYQASAEFPTVLANFVRSRHEQFAQ
jgi:hypothetical protein